MKRVHSTPDPCFLHGAPWLVPYPPSSRAARGPRSAATKPSASPCNARASSTSRRRSRSESSTCTAWEYGSQRGCVAAQCEALVLSCVSVLRGGSRRPSSCGAGVGLFALVHQNATLLVDGPRATYGPALYLDAHGEEDRGLRRGRPLTLDGARAAQLHRLWVTQAVPLQVARARAAAASVIRLAYY